jgi:proline iminopeptidase
MGGDRGGWYSWDRLDNGGRPSAREVHPEWQGLSLGDSVKYWTAAVGAKGTPTGTSLDEGCKKRNKKLAHAAAERL